VFRYPIIFMTLLALTACSPEVTSDPEELMQLDRDFSAYSAEHGAPAAWAEFFAPDSVQLNGGSQPMLGLERILESFADWPDGAQLTWAPEDGEISAAGDLGYTWGRYVLKLRDENGNDVVRQGKYTTIWKRQKSSQWKVVLDIGNPNPPPNPLP
jgi:ketosteroid isomerase-like protein